MKITKTLVSVFLVTFLIGYGSVLPTKKISALQEISNTIPNTLPTPTIETKVEDESGEEYEGVENYDAKFKIKLLEIGEFHGDEVKAKSGEIWFGLFKQANGFYLRTSKIKVERVHDTIVDDEDKRKKTGKNVSVFGKNQPIFLLKNLKFLKERKINTIFYAENKDDVEVSINNEFSKTYDLDNIAYNLFVTPKRGKDMWLDENSKLMLSDGKTEQVIYSQNRCNDCNWELRWAGDLDGDRKLDLYFNLSDHYNVNQYRLFLSSQAEAGKLVKEVANFRIVGC